VGRKLQYPLSRIHASHLHPRARIYLNCKVKELLISMHTASPYSTLHYHISYTVHSIIEASTYVQYLVRYCSDNQMSLPWSTCVKRITYSCTLKLISPSGCEKREGKSWIAYISRCCSQYRSIGEEIEFLDYVRCVYSRGRGMVRQVVFRCCDASVGMGVVEDLDGF
jgi:hypothetical protein